MEHRALEIINILDAEMNPEIDKLSFVTEAFFDGNLNHITDLTDDVAKDVLNGLYLILEEVCDTYKGAYARIHKIYQKEFKEWQSQNKKIKKGVSKHAKTNL